MIEYEKKIMLTANEYDTLIMLKGMYLPITRQENHYFDTDELLMNSLGITCRVRHKNDKFTATVKRHSRTRQDESFEYNVYEKSYFDPEPFYESGLQYQGKLVTDRIIVFEDEKCQIVLDCNKYLGKIDYELEAEYSKGNKKYAMSFLDDIADALVATFVLDNKAQFWGRVAKGKTKSERFFEQKLVKAGK